MADYTVSTSASEEEALQWAAKQANQDAATYFDARMHEVLHSYEQQHDLETSTVPPDEVAVAYAEASTATQIQVNQLLGVTALPNPPNTPVAPV